MESFHRKVIFLCIDGFLKYGTGPAQREKMTKSTLVLPNFPTMTKFISAVFQIIYSLLIIMGRHFTLFPSNTPPLTASEA